MTKPDYDDWNLNGDIIVCILLWSELLSSSMGIRVEAALSNQLKLAVSTGLSLVFIKNC